MAWLTSEHAPTYKYYYTEFGRSALKGCKYKCRRTSKIEMGGVADPKIHAPPPHVLSRQIW